MLYRPFGLNQFMAKGGSFWAFLNVTYAHLCDLTFFYSAFLLDSTCDMTIDGNYL